VDGLDKGPAENSGPQPIPFFQAVVSIIDIQRGSDNVAHERKRHNRHKNQHKQ